MVRITTATFLTILLSLPPLVYGQTANPTLDSLRRIAAEEGWTFELGESPVTKRPLSTLTIPPPVKTGHSPAPVFMPTLPEEQLPESWDWREMNGVTPIKAQEQCGACWAFAAVGMLESNIRIRDNVIIDLSEQHLLDCNLDHYDCYGGFWTHSYHLPSTHPEHEACRCDGSGPVFEEYMPYLNTNTSCPCPHPHATQYCIDGWGYIGEPFTVPSVQAMKEAIMRYGPIGVMVYVDNAFTYYRDGVFNACVDHDINHVVILVGWDDNLGENGAWILRNSWSRYWGLNGYMYIEYDCHRIGYHATFVDYNLPDIILWADTTYGPAPLEVNFGATAGPLTVDSWTWDFGDGDSSALSAPAHIYDSRGAYDVSVAADAGGETYNITRPMYIIAYDDTISGHDVADLPGEQVVVTLSTANSAPVQYIRIPVTFGGGDFALTYDSFSTVGCRTHYFENQGYAHYDPWFGQSVTVKLVSSYVGTSPELYPGDGPICKLFFTIPDSAAEGQATPVLLDGYDIYFPEFQGSIVDYFVTTQDFVVSCGQGCCQVSGDVDHSGQLDPVDIVSFVDWLWASGASPPCMLEADADNSGQTDASDLVYLIDYIWKFGPEPQGCD